MSVPTPNYVYRATLRRVIDGDTCVLRIDLGCHIHRDTEIRVLGVDTPEPHGATMLAGHAATAYAVQWFGAAGGDDWPLVVATQLDRADKYGRLLGTIYRTSDGQQLNQSLIDAGHAVPYTGGKR